MFAICLDHGISDLGRNWFLLFNHTLLIFLLACLLSQFVLEICKFTLSILLFDKNSLTLSLFGKSWLAYLCEVSLLCWLLSLLHHLLSLGLIATISTLDEAIKLAHVLLEYVLYAFQLVGSAALHRHHLNIGNIPLCSFLRMFSEVKRREFLKALKALMLVLLCQLGKLVLFTERLVGL